MTESPDWYAIGQERRAKRQDILEESGVSFRDIRIKSLNQEMVSTEDATTLITKGRLDEVPGEALILPEASLGRVYDSLKTLDELDIQATGFQGKSPEHRQAYRQARKRAKSQEQQREVEAETLESKLFTELASIDAFLARLKREEYKALRNPHPKLAEKLRNGAELEQSVKVRLSQIEADPNLALYAREYQLRKYREALEQSHFVQTESRTKYIEEIETLVKQGKPILLEGHTGTGKSELARIAARELTGIAPEVVYCNPQTRQSDIWGKQALKNKDGVPVTEVDFGPLVRAMESGSLCLFDEFNELDPRQRQVLKYLYNARPGDSIDAPGDGKVTIREGFGLIMTANLKSEKYKAKGELEPQEARVFLDSALRVEYMEAPELYDVALTALSDNDGRLLLTQEEAEVTLRHLVDAIHDIQTAYTKSIPAMYGTDQELGGATGIGKKKRPSLEKYVIDPGMMVRLLQGFRIDRMKYGTHLRDFLDSALARTLTGDRVSEDDKRLALFMLAKHGFLQNETTWKSLDLDQSSGRLNPSIFPKLAVTPIPEEVGLITLSPETVARIDPYHQRKITVADALAEFGDTMDRSVREALGETERKSGEISLAEAETIMGEQCLGPTAIRETFGVTLDTLPAIPFDQQMLIEAKQRGTILVLQIDRLADGTPLSGKSIHERFGQQKDGKKFLHDTTWYQDETFFTAETPSVGWRLVAPDVLTGTKSKNYFDQTEALRVEVEKIFIGGTMPSAYQEAIREWDQAKGAISPLMNDASWKEAAEKLSRLKLNDLCRESFIERLYLMKLANHTKGERILPRSYTWTRSRSSDGDLVSVGLLDGVGADVSGDSPRIRDDDLGVAFSRHA